MGEQASKYTDIIERLVNTERPNEELGVRVKCALLAPATAYVEKSSLNGAWVIYDGEWQGQPRCFEYRGIPNEIRLSNPTESIDAAIALVERALPSHTAGMLPGVRGHTWASVRYVSDVEVNTVAEAKAKTPALAILLALFEALELKGAA